MIFDKWQLEVLKTEGNVVIRSGRQVGKSTIIGRKTAEYALNHMNKTVMVISKTERQAGLLFTKILRSIHEIGKLAIKKGKDRPTKTKISLKNGTIIHCLPCGDTGYGIMGFTIDLLIADEAAFIPEEVWNSIIPALAITRGAIWLLSTPFIKQGYYYECFQNPTFTSFHTTSEDCPRKDEVFLAEKKSTLTKAEYAQMYLGEFIDDATQFFSDELIKKACILEPSANVGGRSYFLGVDIARMGSDESSFETFDGTNKKAIFQVAHEVTTKTFLTDTTDKIKELDRKYNYGRKAIGIDDAGLGAGVYDFLMLDDQVKRKIVGLSNARKSIDRDDRKKKIMKEDMYNNMRMLMEKGELKLLNDDEIKFSLKSIQGVYNKETGKLKISGIYDHIAEGDIRGAWCAKNKSLNIYIY